MEDKRRADKNSKRYTEGKNGNSRRNITMSLELIDFLLAEADKESQIKNERVSMTDLILRALYNYYPEAPKTVRKFIKDLE